MKEFDHDMITRYLEGEMNEGETRAFETQMQGDADLKNVVELYRDVNQTLKMKLHPGEKESALRNTLGDMRSDFFSTKTTEERVRRDRLILTACVRPVEKYRSMLPGKCRRHRLRSRCFVRYMPSPCPKTAHRSPSPTAHRFAINHL